MCGIGALSIFLKSETVVRLCFVLYFHGDFGYITICRLINGCGKVKKIIEKVFS